ncbi:MAG: hypothetical protein K6V73_07070 [Firmicutes bacterium]|nr:hypothetical protein [Bacillota bacterium]
MSVAGWAALVTCLISAVLAASLARQYVGRRRPYQLWWGISFFAAAVAALLQTVAFARGAWSVEGYRAYIVLAAAVPGLMGTGTVFLLYRRWAPYFAAVIVLSALLTAWGAAGSVRDLTSFGVLDAAAQVTRTMPYWQVQFGFGILGALGGAALVLGALWSWWRTREAFHWGIVIGGLVFSAADSFTALGGPSAAIMFFAAEVIGSTALYLAVRAAGTRRADAAAPARAVPHRA